MDGTQPMRVFVRCLEGTQQKTLICMFKYRK